MMRILFLHGWRSFPDVANRSYLTRRERDVVNPALDNRDPAEAVPISGSDGAETHSGEASRSRE